MKAKELASRLGNWIDDGSLEDVMFELMKETRNLFENRKCKVDSAFIAVIREQNNKWQAVCRLVPTLPKDMFEKAFEVYFDKLYIAVKNRSDSPFNP